MVYLFNPAVKLQYSQQILRILFTFYTSSSAIAERPRCRVG